MESDQIKASPSTVAKSREDSTKMDSDQSESSATTSARSALEEMSKEDLIKKCKNILTIAQKAKKAKDDCGIENQKLRQEISTSKEMVEALMTQKVDMTQKLDQLKTQMKKFNDVDTENESLKRQTQRLETENDKLLNHLEVMEKQIGEMTEIGMDQRMQLLGLLKGDITISSTTSEDPHNELQNMLSISLEEVKTTRDLNNKLKLQIEDYEAQLEVSNTKYACLEMEIVKRNNQIEELKSKLKENVGVMQSKDGKIEELGGMMDKINVQKLEILERENTLKRENERLQYQASTGNGKLVDEKEGVMKELEETKEKLIKMNELYEKSVKEFEDQLGLHELKHAEKVTELNTEVTKLNDHIEKYKTKLSSYRTKLKKLAGSVTDLKQSKQSLLETANDCNQSIQTWRQELLNLLQTLSSVKPTEHPEQEQIVNLAKENEQLKLIKDKNLEEFKSLNAELQSLRERNDELIDEHNAKVDELESQNIQLAETLEKVKRQMGEENLEIKKEIQEITAKSQDKLNENTQEMNKLKNSEIELRSILKKTEIDFKKQLEDLQVDLKQKDKEVQEALQIKEKIQEESIQKTKEKLKVQEIKAENICLKDINKQLESKTKDLELKLKELEKLDQEQVSKDTFNALETQLEQTRVQLEEIIKENQQLDQIKVKTIQAVKKFYDDLILVMKLETFEGDFEVENCLNHLKDGIVKELKRLEDEYLIELEKKTQFNEKLHNENVDLEEKYIEEKQKLQLEFQNNVEMLNRVQMENKQLLEARNELQEKIKAIQSNSRNGEQTQQKLIEENEELKLQLQKFSSKIESLLEAQKQIETQLSSLTTENNKLIHESQEKQKHINEIQINLDKTTQRFQSNKEYMEKLQTENENLCKNLQTKDETIEESNQKLQQLSIKLESLTKQNEDSSKTNEDLQKLKEELTANQNNKLEMSQQIQELSLKLATLTDEYSTNIEKELKKRDELNLKIEELISQLKNQNDEFNKLSDEFKIKEEKITQLNKLLEERLDNSSKLSESELKEKEIKLTELEDELSQIKKQNNELNEQLNEKYDIINEINQKLEMQTLCENQLRECQLKNDQLQFIVNQNGSNVTDEIKSQKIIITELEKSNSKLKSSNAEMSLVVADLEQKNAEILKEMQEMVNELKLRGENLSKLQDLQIQLQINMEKLQIENNQKTKDINSKDIEINQLERELETLKERLQDDSISTSTISKVDESNRLADIEGTWEERYNKLKQIDVKLKKRVNLLNGKLKSGEEEKEQLEKRIDEMEEEIEKLKEKASVDTTTTAPPIKSTPDNQKLAQEIENLKKEKSITSNALKEFKNEIKTLQSTKKELEQKLCSLEMDLKGSEIKLQEEIGKHKETKEQLIKANKECKKKSVLSLEMEDYERSLKDVSNKLKEKQIQIGALECTIDTQSTTITSLKDQIRGLDDRLKAEQVQTNQCNNQLLEARALIKQYEDGTLGKEEQISKLETALEKEKNQLEEINLQLTKAVTDSQKSLQQYKQERDQLRAVILNLEERIRQLTDNFESSEAEIVRLRTEYANYKIRATSALRQNKEGSNSPAAHDLQQLTEETNELRAQVESLEHNLKSIQTKYQILTTNYEKVQEEKADVEAKSNELLEILETLRQEHDELLEGHLRQMSEQTEALRSQKIRNETLAQCYKQQINELEERCAKEVDDLKQKLNENNNKGGSLVKGPPAYVNVKNDLDIQNMPREDGEGSESIESVYNSSSQPIPLDQLLNNDNKGMVQRMNSSSPTTELRICKEQLIQNDMRISHLTGLLSDAEKDAAKLSQLNQILKEEIRRHQRSVEREQHAENLEYLKNVVFKFITLGYGDEKSHLVPVLNTILRLSPEETQKLNAVAKGVDPNTGRPAWSSYLPLPKWP